MSIATATNKTYLAGEDMSADVEGPAIDCTHNDNLRLQLSWTDAGSPVGKLIIEGSEDGVTWFAVVLGLAMIHAITADATLSADGDIDLDGTAAGSVALNIKDPFGFMRVRYVQSSGGTGDFLSAKMGKRS